MTIFHLSLEEAKIERFAVISGDSNRCHSRRILISGDVKDLLGYDFITDDISSGESTANYLEITIHATEDSNRIAQRDPPFIFREKLFVMSYVDPSYFDYLLSLISNNSLEVYLEMEVILSKEEIKETFWGMSETRELGFEHIEVDESHKGFKAIKSGIEIDSKCSMVMTTLIMKSSQAVTDENKSNNPFVIKDRASSDAPLIKGQLIDKNLLIAIALLLFFILLKI